MSIKNEVVSVITIVKNDRENIEKTMLSVLKQTYAKVEYVVKNALSDDGTNEIIERIKKNFPEKKLLHINESDAGIYDAMNQAIKYCTGEWIIFMNSGDVFFNENILEIIFKNKEYKNYGVLYGDAIVRDEAGDAIWKANMSVIKEKMPFCHQSCLVKRTILMDNSFKTEYKIAADYNNILELYLKKINFFYLEMIISIFDLSGISSVKFVARCKEKNKIINNNGCKMLGKVERTMELLTAYIKEMLADTLPDCILIKMKKWYKHYIKRYEKYIVDNTKNSVER